MKKMSNLKRTLKYIKPYSFYVVISLLCSVITSVSQLLIPIFCGKAIDFMISEGTVIFDGVLKYIVYIAFTIAAAALSQNLLSLCNNKITYNATMRLRNEAVEKINSLPVSYLDTHPAGDLLSRVISDAETLSDGLLMGFTQFFTGIISIIGTFLIMLFYNLTITMIVVLLTPLSLFVAAFIAKRTNRYFIKQASVRGEQTAMINEIIDGSRVISAYSHEAEIQSEFDEINESFSDVALKATFFSSLTNPSTRLVNNIVYAGVCLAGALYAIHDGITVGVLSIFLSYASSFAKPFNEISGVVTELQNALTCAGRIFKLLDEPSRTPDKANAKDLHAKGNVELKNISFSYTPEKPLLQNISLNVSQGRKIAIVGPTGCGKTTLINLLMRFYDVNSGSITIDNTDIRDIKRISLRKSFGMVLQDTWLKHGTVKENIAYANPNATDEEIINAAKKAHAHSFIQRLPNGYNTMITENGENLSAGQKQLLCIARIMLSIPPMLILDEATSSIDTRTEIKIQSAFNQMMNGRTSFIVAHRLSTIKNADIILVMRDGNIIEQGNHDELLKKDGFYAQLYNSQFSA